VVDSLAFDFHKWFSIPYDVGCVLVRDQQVHKQTFTDRAAYLNLAEVVGSVEANMAPKVRGLGGGGII
jgi:glutamate/tyrosine decarboxylase-like PLP-dependent enzyme